MCLSCACLEQSKNLHILEGTLTFYKLETTSRRNTLNQVTKTQPAYFIGRLCLHLYCNQEMEDEGKKKKKIREQKREKKHLIETLRARSVRERGRIKLHNCIIIPVDT